MKSLGVNSFGLTRVDLELLPSCLFDCDRENLLAVSRDKSYWPNMGESRHIAGVVSCQHTVSVVPYAVRNFHVLDIVHPWSDCPFRLPPMESQKEACLSWRIGDSCREEIVWMRLESNSRMIPLC